MTPEDDRYRGGAYSTCDPVPILSSGSLPDVGPPNQGGPHTLECNLKWMVSAEPAGAITRRNFVAPHSDERLSLAGVQFAGLSASEQ